MTVINPKSISGITSITMPSGADNVLTIHTTDGTERFRIDSSGNVKVGSAATISPDGDLFVTGVCTATTLSGAASGLTGALPAISAANLTNIPAANVTGTLPALSAASLTSIPAANIVGVATAGFGNASGAFSQGITMADQWRITTAQNTNDTTLIYNWERNDNQSTLIGAGMATNAGHWTFPTTGLYLIMFGADAYNSSQTRYVGGNIDHSTDSGSSYAAITESYSSLSSDTNAYAQVQMHAFYDVTNTSTQRVRFRIVSEFAVQWAGSSSINRIYATFLRLGDT